MSEEKEFSLKNIFGKPPANPVNLGYSGPLTIRVTQAKLDKDKDLFGKMDPFCVINVGGKTFTTKQAQN